ncbi:NACHT domain-containing protein [Streptomyces sp. B93]|uniref:NACHT domain-containing protein n=1 Tax=Streptomyces sp. B93 TaxID=2824875 RepID=UPI001B38607B|nr:NACHT domain-containing protein [Streptomyces sp. B93]MBQ1091708.1 NACHT domain-containing protein [Streptomyces sp. B93]
MSNSLPPVHNTVVDSTVETLVQIGVLNGGTVEFNFFPQSPLPVDPLDEAAHTLAERVFRQWREEANTWDIVNPAPMRVRWRASWPDADHPSKVGGEVTGDGDRVGTMAEAFLALEQRRLVLLGESGAGKTTLAVLLALDLLARRFQDGDRGPVPVILRLETWDAERDHLHTWLARQITEEYPGLPRVEGRHPAALLVSDRRVLPVLDGLNELPEHRRHAVVQHLNQALTDGDPLILTSRTAEYRRVREQAGVVSSTAVIEALPVEGQDAVAYLTGETSPGHVHRWAPVFEELLESPPEPVALALSSPLMLWLARRVYALPPADPAELIRTDRFPTRASIEEHLLDRIVPTVFARTPHAPDRLHAPGLWNPARARRYLDFLATHLSERRTAELAWWRLHREPVVLAVAVPVALVLCLLVVWTAEGVATWLLGSPWSGPEPAHPGPKLAFGTGLTLTALLLAVQRFWFRRHDGQPRRLANPFRLGAALRSASRAVSVGRTLRAASLVLLPSAAFAGYALTTPHPEPFLVATACSSLLAPLVLAAVSAPSDTADASDPHALLRDERRALLLSLVTIAPLIGVGQGAIDWFAPEESRAVGVSALFGWFGSAVLLVGFSPWSRWVLAKASLAVLGRVPWSLMEFLRDAHRLGLLQRGGGVYRFRNLRLRDHFAGRREAPAPDLAHASFAAAGRAHRADPRSTSWKALADDDRTPLGHRPKWTVREDERSFHAGGRHRVVPVAHWNAVFLASALSFVMFAVDGNWRIGLRYVAFWFAVGVAAMVVRFLAGPITLDLRLTHDHLTYVVGRRTGVVPWDDIALVEVTTYSHRGWKGAAYGVVIALHPGVPTPHRSLRAGDGRFLVLPLLSLSPFPPPDLEAALARFAGVRWRPPWVH